MTNKVALYSCNFGNYRNELLKNNINNIFFDNNIDYYFFTDNILLKSEKWNIIIYNKIKEDDIMESSRWTSKNVKFILPDILKSYETVIWIDNKLFNDKFNINISKINNLFVNNKYKLFNLLHNKRKTPQEELNITIKYNLENKKNAIKFINEIKNIKFNTLLVDTCIIIRKIDDETNKLFEYIYELLKLKGLKRDQNVYNYAIDRIAYPIENINYITINFIYN
jgi:hypothetical protein